MSPTTRVWPPAPPPVWTCSMAASSPSAAPRNSRRLNRGGRRERGGETERRWLLSIRTLTTRSASLADFGMLPSQEHLSAHYTLHVLLCVLCVLCGEYRRPPM